ncbi:diguanylate cyclase [Fusibacter sp. JL216-2]|uniref:sensor domain-containing diguanylate cyclase n=1 Tax=Fusibacter sp. JL216-2 TaxID=3071453 RepID=UPI003D34FDE6
MKSSKSSIVNRLTRSIVLIIVLQTIILGAILIGGGVIRQANLNAYQLFHDKVTNRKYYIETEMKNKWINFDPYLKNIKYSLEEEYSLNESITQELIDVIRNTRVTGAYLMLLPSNGIEAHLPSIYLRDYDPIMNSYAYDDIYMVAGPAELAKRFNMPLDQLWRPYFNVEDGHADFLKKPYDSTMVTSRVDLLGYWSKPFNLEEGDIDVITYSIPFLNTEGDVIGIMGIEISLSYLYDFLPTNELQPQDSLGYLIAYRSNETAPLRPIVMNGALQKRMIQENEALSLDSVNPSMNLFQLTNHLGSENIYMVTEKIGLYKNNTPFENEEWFLVGIMREDHLLSYSNRIKQILWGGLLLAILIGTTGGILVSYQMTRPIVTLAEQVKRSGGRNLFEFDRTGFDELDELSSAIERAHEMSVESASRLSKIVNMTEVPIAAYEIDKESRTFSVTTNFGKIISQDHIESVTYEAFIKALESKLIKVDGEPDIFKVISKKDKWIRHRRSETDNMIIGAIVDVTQEFMEKKRIEHERDHDHLTNILNRKGFEWEFEAWYARAVQNTCALIMFDLDNLKSVNDQFGHEWGDKYIVTFVKSLMTIGPSDKSIVGRRSGDEFVCLLYNYDSKDAVRKILSDFYEKLSSEPLVFPNGTQRPVGVSGGLIWIEDHSLEYKTLLHKADEALYHAKASDKGMYYESQNI